MHFDTKSLLFFVKVSVQRRRAIYRVGQTGQFLYNTFLCVDFSAGDAEFSLSLLLEKQKYFVKHTKEEKSMDFFTNRKAKNIFR